MRVYRRNYPRDPASLTSITRWSTAIGGSSRLPPMLAARCCPSSQLPKEFEYLLESFDLNQSINGPTHQLGLTQHLSWTYCIPHWNTGLVFFFRSSPYHHLSSSSCSRRIITSSTPGDFAIAFVSTDYYIIIPNTDFFSDFFSVPRGLYFLFPLHLLRDCTFKMQSHPKWPGSLAEWHHSCSEAVLQHCLRARVVERQALCVCGHIEGCLWGCQRYKT